MATIFEPSASLRAPYSTAAAPSMADTLPNINFGFDELRDRMAKFTYKFDEFIAEGRKRVLEERNSFRMNIAELEGTLIVFLRWLFYTEAAMRAPEEEKKRRRRRRSRRRGEGEEEGGS